MQPGPADTFTIQMMGMEEGPYTFADLQIMLRAGRLKAETLVRRNGGNWFLAKEIPGLFSPKSWLVAVILAAMIGYLGIDRMYVGHVGLGILKLLTCGGFYIWWFIDIILFATGKVTDSNGLPLSK